ncbi:MAG: DUF4091 domain-containing protein [Planctomycetia bacterium]|nr:DUF4091 domain-containing protein [Planctomycetia bacterium]
MKIHTILTSVLVLGAFWAGNLNLTLTADETSEKENTAWNMKLSASDGGFWMKRVSFTLQISDELLAELKARNGQDETVDEKTIQSREAMKVKLTPTEFTFKVVTEEEAEKAEKTGNSAKMLPIAGCRAQDIRVCDEKNREYIFQILNAQGEAQRRGVLTSGAKVIIPIELTTISQDAHFYVYYDNSRAWVHSDWWETKRFANGDFETGDKTVKNWVLDQNDAEHKIQWAVNEGRDGSRGIRTDVTKGAELSWIGARQNGIAVKAGERYRLTGWTKAENVEGYAGWFYHVGNDKKPMLGSGMLYAGDGTYDWKRTEQEFTVPEGAVRVTVGTVLRGTGTAWADDVKLELLSEEGQEVDVPCTVGEVESFPLSERYPSLDMEGGSPEFNAETFFGTQKLPRFSFVRVVNDTDVERKVLVNVRSELLTARWGVELNAESVEVFGLDGKKLDFETGSGNLFVEPVLPAKSVTYLVLAEKPDAVSRKEVARREREESNDDSAFPGTSLQNTATVSRGASLDNAGSLASVLKKNLVKNASFEELNEKGEPRVWTYGPAQEGVTCRVGNPGENGILGEHCAEILVEEGVRPNWCGWRQVIEIEPGRTYFCGAWMKSPKDAPRFSIHVHFHNEKHQLTTTGGMTSFSGIPVGAGEWSLVTGMLQAPEDATFLTLQMTTNEMISLAYDNVFVTEMEMGVPERFQGGSTGFFQVSPIVKIFPDSTWSLNPEEKKAYECRTISTAKNEEETIQFAFRYSADRKYQVSLCPAVSEDGKTVLPTELFAVGYVPVKHVTSYYQSYLPKWFRKLPGHNGAADGWVGSWPDPLIPFQNAKKVAESDAKNENGSGAETIPTPFIELEAAREAWAVLENAEYTSDSERLCRFAEQNLLGFRAWETRALQIIVKTGKTVPAGVYSGKIRFRNLETGKVTFVPFSVDVKDFAIPDEPVCGAIYDARPTHPEYWTEKKDISLLNRMTEFLASKRLASDKMEASPKFEYHKETGKWTADFTEFDAACEHYFGDLKIRYSYMPGDWYCFGWGMPPRARQGIDPYEGEWPYEGADRGKLRPEFKKVYQDKLRLMWNHIKEKGWDKNFVLYISDEPFYSKPEIIAQMIACCEMIHEVDPDIPIYASTWHHIPEWDGHITVWGIGHFGIVPEEQIKKSKARGDRVWWTTDGQMCTDTPYCATERLLPYWCMKYGADAYEFWGASWFTYDPYQYGWHSYIHQSDQPGVEYYVLYPNGDGYIFYPDKLLGVEEIVSSIRLEQAREGVEDAAYIVMLRDEIARVKTLENRSASASQTLQNAENTLSRVYDLVHIPNAGGRFTSRYLPNPEEVDEVKILMLQLIEELRKVK